MGAAGSRADVRAVDAGLIAALQAIGVEFSTRPVDRVAASVDASHYLLIPEIVATPRHAGDVGALMLAAAHAGRPLTFRAGGTSLSGQSVTDSVLVDVRQHFSGIDVGEAGLTVSAQSGAVLAAVNARLRRHGRRFGPDPASESACTIGGVVANNSSGMCCGTEQNSYRTLTSMVLVLPSGTVLDTAEPDADAQLRRHEPDLHALLARLRDEIRGDAALRAEVQRQYRLKNTMGYGLNSFLDHDEPVHILEHLMIGSEGTLGFVAEARFDTVPVLSHAATALVVFDSLDAATRALPALVQSRATVIELLDAASLEVVSHYPEAAGVVPDGPFTDQAALLVEYQAADADALQQLAGPAAALLADLPGAQAGELTSDPGTRKKLWHLRKGLYATVAGARPPGTTALLEDIAVPVEELADVCAALQQLFARHGYAGSVIFGHARFGNIHFLVNIDFDDPDAVRTYEAFTADMVDLVLGSGGTLKAEHGTGRIMAPFVRRQYGDRLHALMWQVKRACDPAGICNPGAVLTDDPELHIRHLKPVVRVEPEVDRCVECGFCEPVCPSRSLTLTPRQRIVTRRARAMAAAAGRNDLATELEAPYEVVDTCAVDGMCATACPVGINTGDLVRRLRAEDAGRIESAAWDVAARGWDPFTRAGSVGLSVARALPTPLVEGGLGLARAVLGADTVPLLAGDRPAGGRRRAAVANPAAEVVVFASCTGTLFASPAPDAAAALLQILDACGVAYRTPAHPDTLCCGTPWKSKGMLAGHHRMAEQVTSALLEATDGGRLPVLVDASSCAEGLLVALGDAPIEVIDATTFVAGLLTEADLTIDKLRRVAVHPTCASTQLGSTDALLAIARALADEVVVPDGWGCCAFAGDRGLLHPELTASATGPEMKGLVRAEAEGGFDAFLSSNRTCEWGLSRASGRGYRHVLSVLVERVRHA